MKLSSLWSVMALCAVAALGACGDDPADTVDDTPQPVSPAEFVLTITSPEWGALGPDARVPEGATLSISVPTRGLFGNAGLTVRYFDDAYPEGAALHSETIVANGEETTTFSWVATYPDIDALEVPISIKVKLGGFESAQALVLLVPRIELEVLDASMSSVTRALTGDALTLRARRIGLREASVTIAVEELDALGAPSQVASETVSFSEDDTAGMTWTIATSNASAAQVAFRVNAEAGDAPYTAEAEVVAVTRGILELGWRAQGGGALPAGPVNDGTIVEAFVETHGIADGAKVAFIILEVDPFGGEHAAALHTVVENNQASVSWAAAWQDDGVVVEGATPLAEFRFVAFVEDATAGTLNAGCRDELEVSPGSRYRDFGGESSFGVYALQADGHAWRSPRGVGSEQELFVSIVMPRVKVEGVDVPVASRTATLEVLVGTTLVQTLTAEFFDARAAFFLGAPDASGLAGNSDSLKFILTVSDSDVRVDGPNGDQRVLQSVFLVKKGIVIAEWVDEDGEQVYPQSTVQGGTPLQLRVDTVGIADGATVTCGLWESDTFGDDELGTLPSATLTSGTALLSWTAAWGGEPNASDDAEIYCKVAVADGVDTFQVNSPYVEVPGN